MNLGILKKILIIRISSLGDILLTTPFIRSLKKSYPNLMIDFLLKEEYSDLLKHNPYLSKLFFYKKDKKNFKLLIADLAQEDHQLIIDLQNNFRSAGILSKLKGLKLKFNKRTFDKLLLVNFKINKLKDALQVPVRYANTVKGFELDDKGLDLFTKDEPSLLNIDKKYIGFCPGARHFTKIWPPEYYIELGNKLSKAGVVVLLFGGKSDRKICSGISKQIPDSIDLSNDDQILQTAADMKRCLAIVCNDSGLMHAACALKVPVLAIFGSTVKEFGFTPYKNKNLILENNFLSCRPCSHIGRANCPKGHFKCMLELSPETAFKKLTLLLN